jgi:hypothetical protein
MRTFLLLTLFSLLAGLAHAQDLLTKRNGEELNVKVVEITPAEVRYRRADNPDGPLISVWRSDVFLIRYANGAKEVLNPSAAAPVPAAPLGASGPLSPAPAVRAAFPTDVRVVSNTDPNDAVLDEPIHLDGPRIGITYLSNGVLSKAGERDVHIGSVISQFGWQFESRLFRLPNGVSGLVEFVPLVGGLDQGYFLPSVSGLLGVRGRKGLEFGVGPNVTLMGAGLVVAMGTSIQSNGINFPINLALAPSKDGARVSLVVGFNARHR